MKRISTILATTLLCIITLSPRGSFASPFSQKDIINILQKQAVMVFGGQRANLNENNAFIKDTLFLFLGITHEPKSMIDGYVFMEGCRVHSCTEKGAVIVDMKAKNLLAASLLHFNCRLTVLTPNDLKTTSKGKRRPAKSECDSEATLEMFLIRRNSKSAKPTDENQLLDDMRLWGKTAGYARENVRILELH